VRGSRRFVIARFVRSALLDRRLGALGAVSAAVWARNGDLGWWGGVGAVIARFVRSALLDHGLRALSAVSAVV
jgi:hypothetical protein